MGHVFTRIYGPGSGGYKPMLEADLNTIPAGEPVLLYQKTDFERHLLLYVQPTGRIGVEVEATSERLGDQVDVYDIDLCGLCGRVYHVSHCLYAELERYKVENVEKVHFTSDSEFDDDLIAIHGRASIEKVLRDPSHWLDSAYYPLIEQFMERLAP